MPEHWSRRAVLVGLAALAGCTSADDPEADAGGAESPSPTPATSTPTRHSPITPSNPTVTDTESPPEHERTTEGAVPEPPERLDTEWPVPAADAGRSNYASGATGPTERVAELWRLTANTTFSTPVVAAGTVFVCGESGPVWALDGRSGAKRWRESVGASAGAPRAVGDHLYVPTAEELVALRRADGTESWRVETPGRAAVLVAAHGAYWIDGDAPAVVALARDDGSERWRTSIADPWEPTLFASDTSVFVSSGTHDSRFWTLSAETGEVTAAEPRSGADFPAERLYADGTVYAVDGFFGNVRATPVDGDGWSQGVNPAGGAGGGLLSVGADRVYYTSNADGAGLYALSKTDGTVAWTADVPAPVTGRPVVAEEAVLLPTDAGVRCLDPADGDEQWTHPDLGGRLALVDDLLYAAGDATVRAFRPP